MSSTELRVWWSRSLFALGRLTRLTRPDRRIRSATSASAFVESARPGPGPADPCVRPLGFLRERTPSTRPAAGRRDECGPESFSALVAHELGGPLRSVNGFAALLQDHAAGMSAEAQEHLRRIVAGGRRMELLVERLRELADVRSGPFAAEPIDLSVLAESVVEEAIGEHARRLPWIEIEQGLEDFGEPTLVRVVLRNLIANALKFTAAVPVPWIRFGRFGPSGDNAYYVRDNGAGFCTQDAERLFRPFVRLHSGQGYEGSGIGLALVREIVARHGGEVWADATPGAGATFAFTLGPASPGARPAAERNDGR